MSKFGQIGGTGSAKGPPRFGIFNFLKPGGVLNPFGLPNGQGGSFGNKEGGDDSGKEVCWQKTKFKGKYKVDPVKPVVKFSIVFEMWCECGPEDDPSSDDYTLGEDNFIMDKETKPPCSEFSGKFKERTFGCPSPDDQSTPTGFDFSDPDPDCCSGIKCATVEKEISFEDLMPIPFELLTQAGLIANNHACQHGPNAPLPPDTEGSEGPGWENTGDDTGDSTYALWGSEPGHPPPEAGRPDRGVPLTPRAQAMRIFGCTVGRFGGELMDALQDIIPELDSGVRSGQDFPIPGSGGILGYGWPKDEDDPGPGKWNYARVETPEQRDAVLRETLVCKGVYQGGGKSAPTSKTEQAVADQALELCFTLGGAFDTDYNDSDPGGYGKPDSVGDDDLNAGLRDKGENEGEEPGGWFNKMRPKFDCYKCECINPVLSGIWAPPFDCTDPPCEDPPDIK